MSGFISDCLRENREKILRLWEERARKEVLAAGSSTFLALQDSIPLFLDHLAEALSSDRKLDVQSVLAHDIESIRIGRLHGTHRAGSPDYLLTEVIFEYHILREVIFSALEENQQLSMKERDVILDSIEQAVNDAAVKFSEVHADIQQKFTNTLTHDLKTPITGAKMAAQLIMRRPDRPDACIDLASRIVASMNRLETMVRDLLDASRIRAGEELALKYIECDLDSLVHEIVEQMAVVHGDRFVLDSKEPLIGHWGCEGIRRAIENLVGNAVKYSTPRTPITVSLKRLDNLVHLVVHNEGEPIPEAEQGFLFQQHRRAKSARESSKTGWGLGLTLVKGVMDAHKGRVHVESSPEKGTSFVLEFPFRS